MQLFQNCASVKICITIRILHRVITSKLYIIFFFRILHLLVKRVHISDLNLFDFSNRFRKNILRLRRYPFIPWKIMVDTLLMFFGIYTLAFSVPSGYLIFSYFRVIQHIFRKMVRKWKHFNSKNKQKYADQKHNVHFNSPKKVFSVL